MHRGLALAEDYSGRTKRGEYQYVSIVMGISYKPFLDAEAGAAYKIFEVTELLNFWTEKIIDIDRLKGRGRAQVGWLRRCPKSSACRVLRGMWS